jgi:hypothetical protein
VRRTRLPKGGPRWDHRTPLRANYRCLARKGAAGISNPEHLRQFACSVTRLCPRCRRRSPLHENIEPSALNQDRAGRVCAVAVVRGATLVDCRLWSRARRVGGGHGLTSPSSGVLAQPEHARARGMARLGPPRHVVRVEKVALVHPSDKG